MIRDISIKAVLNGFVCNVGCQQVVFSSVTELQMWLGAYLTNPEETEKTFMAQACNYKHTLGAGPLATQGINLNDIGGGCAVDPQYVPTQERVYTGRNPVASGR